MRYILLIVLINFVTACGIVTPVKPWQRDILARDDMQLNTDELVQLMDEQIYYSKEASHGGRGVGGGGCGCN